MHLVTNSAPVSMGGFGLLAPGRWIASDQNAFEIALLADRGTISLQAVGYRNFKDETEPGHDSLLIVIPGAWGDLLLLTPALRVLRQENLDTKIGLACFKTHHPLFENFDSGIDELLPYPVDAEIAASYDAVISLENTLPKKTDVYATDLFAQELSVTVTNYLPSYLIGSEELKLAQINYPKTDRPRVGLQMVSSVPNRDYPLKQWMGVIQGVINRGWDVVVFGHPMQYPKMKSSPHLTNLTLDKLTFRQSAAVLSQCAAFCGIDSAWLHMCFALNIPAVGLFGPFPWQIRTAKAPLTVALSGTGECAGCQWHLHAGQPFPPDKPCAAARQCSVLASITPERIVSKIDSLKPL